MKKRIRTRIMKAFLSVSIASLAICCIFSQVSLLSVRNQAVDSNTEIGQKAAENSEAALTKQALFHVSDLAEAKAEVFNTEMDKVATNLQLIANYVGYLYTHPDEFKPIPYNHAKDNPKGELAMQWVLSPGMTLASVKDEVYLHGNMKSVYDAVMKSNPSVATIYLTTETGINSGYDKYSDTKPEYFEGRTADWYVRARDTGRLVISDTYQDSFGRGLMVSMSIPCYGPNRKFVGVVGLDILIGNLNEDILKTTVGENGYALLLKGADKVISAPGLKQENETDLEQFLGDNTQEIRQAMSKSATGAGRSVIGGKESYVIWSPVKLTKWNFVVVMPLSDIVAPAESSRASIEQMTGAMAKTVNRRIQTTNWTLIALLALIVAFVVWLTLRISKRITAPISQLTQDVRGLGDGNLDYASDIRTGDEIEELSHSFEHMTRALKEYIANLSRVTADKERIATELNVATQIQTSMLPCIFPAFPEREEFDVYAQMLAAKEVGGDFYDFFLIDDTHLGVVIADVSGKGVPAALFMVIAKTLIKNHAQMGKSAAEVFETVNRQLCENNDAGMFVTSFMGILDLRDGAFTYVNAGHNPPLLRQGGGDFTWLKARPGFVLAGMEGVRYREGSLTLQPGDRLFLYTDGVTEATDRNDQLFGDPRLEAALNQTKDMSLTETLRFVKAEIDAFVDGADQFDDITMLALEFRRRQTDEEA